MERRTLAKICKYSAPQIHLNTVKIRKKGRNTGMKKNWKHSAVMALLVAALAAGALMTACDCSGENGNETTTNSATEAETTKDSGSESTSETNTPESTPSGESGESDMVDTSTTEPATSEESSTKNELGESGTTEEPSTKTETGETDAPETGSAETETETEPVIIVVPDDDEPVVLEFNNDWKAGAQIEKKCEIMVSRSSDRVVITGEGNFTVTYTAADGEKTLTAENGSLTMENTATPHMGMVLTVSVEKKMTLTFTLDFDKGAEENPYDVEEDDSTIVAFTKEAYIRINKAGWYQLEGEGVELTNYSLENDGRVFLAAGVYGLSTTASGEVSVTVTHLETPVGYDESDPAIITEPGTEVSLDLYDGVELYFAYTAKEAGFYEIALGNSGKSVNGRFALDSGKYETYYGRYYTEDGEWLTCAGGKTATVFLVAGQRVIIKADYSLSANMAGGDTLGVVVKVGEGTVNKIADGEGSGTLTKGGQLVFCFTADKDGIYEAIMGMGRVSQSCRFTSSLDNGVYYGSGCDAESKLLKLTAGEVVYFVVDCPSGAEGTVNFNVAAATEQPWPDAIKSGTYVNDGYELTVDRDGRQLSLNGSSKVRAYYLDGQIDFTLTYHNEDTDETSAQAYTLKLAENGVDLELSWESSAGGMSTTDSKVITRTLTYQEPVERVVIGLWEGVYSYTDADGQITKLTIYSDGSGLLGTSRYNITDNGCTYTERNVLQWQNAYTMTIAEQDETGKVTKISMKVYGEEEPILFDRIEEEFVVLPSELPIAVDDKFTGANGYQLYYQGSYQYFNDRVFTIIGYDKESQAYTIAGYDTAAGEEKAEATYRLIMEDAETVKVYDAEGKELLDTLKKEKPVEIPDLKANGQKESSVAVDDAGLIYLKVAKTGWYTFTALSDGTNEMFTTCTVLESGKPSADADSKQSLSMTSGLLLKLTEGTLLGIYGDVSAVYSATEPEAKLGSEKKPYAMTGSTLDVTGLIDGKNVYYVSYTAPETDTYDIGFSIDKMHFVVNGTDYGRSFEGLSWVNYDAICTVTLTKGTTVVIALNRPTTTGDDAFIGVAPTGTLQDVLDAATAANKPVEVTSFATEQQGKYEYNNGASGWDAVSYSLMLKPNGKANLAMDLGGLTTTKKNATVTVKGNVYSIEYDDGTATFTFNDDGSLSFKADEYSDTVRLTIGGVTIESLFSKDEQGTWADAGFDNILIVNENGIYGEIGGVECNKTRDELSKTVDSLWWTFTCEAGTVQFRLTEVGGEPVMLLVVNGEDYTLYAR